MLLTPGHEIAEQSLAFGIVKRLPIVARLVQERLEIAFNALLRFVVWLHQVLQHLLRHAEAIPAGDGRRKINIAPFWVGRRAL